MLRRLLREQTSPIIIIRTIPARIGDLVFRPIHQWDIIGCTPDIPEFHGGFLPSGDQCGQLPVSTPGIMALVMVRLIMDSTIPITTILLDGTIPGLTGHFIVSLPIMVVHTGIITSQDPGEAVPGEAGVAEVG